MNLKRGLESEFNLNLGNNSLSKYLKRLMRLQLVEKEMSTYWGDIYILTQNGVNYYCNFLDKSIHSQIDLSYQAITNSIHLIEQKLVSYSHLFLIESALLLCGNLNREFYQFITLFQKIGNQTSLLKYLLADIEQESKNNNLVKGNFQKIFYFPMLLKQIVKLYILTELLDFPE